MDFVLERLGGCGLAVVAVRSCCPLGALDLQFDAGDDEGDFYLGEDAFGFGHFLLLGWCARYCARVYDVLFAGGCQVKPLRRMSVSKHQSAKKFRGQMRRTKAPNVMSGSQRGGWRL